MTSEEKWNCQRSTSLQCQTSNVPAYNACVLHSQQSLKICLFSFTPDFQCMLVLLKALVKSLLDHCPSYSKATRWWLKIRDLLNKILAIEFN